MPADRASAARRLASRGTRSEVCKQSWPDQLGPRDVELVQLVDEPLMAGVLEPDELLRACAQCVEIRNAGLWRNQGSSRPREKEHRHLQCGRELDEVQARALCPHRVHRQPEPAPSAGSATIDDSCPPRTVRRTFHMARGLIRPSKRDSHLRSVNTASAGYSGGPIARSFLTPDAANALRCGEREPIRGHSPAAQSPICPQPTMSRMSREMGGERRRQARQLMA